MAGQKYVNPSEAGILMSLESVFALLAGMVILKEMMSIRELTGCLIMFIAVLLAN
jgi:drug/metabolite transporter (DMT)-like permease